MLVTDPSKRAPLSEIVSHPWLTKGLSGPPDNFLPLREPLQLPLDSAVIEKMTGFEFGSADFIRRSLEGMIESSDYQRAVKQASHRPSAAQPAESDRKRGGMFDFYQRRKSASSREVLATPSSDTLHLGDDPVNAYAPLISIYYLAREKLDREKSESNPGGLSIPQSPGNRPLQLPDLPAPEAAVTNSSSYEMAGEAPTGGRTRPRARTHGEDEIDEKSGPPKIQEPSDAGSHPPRLRTPPAKRESTAAGLLRRISTRKRRDSDNEKVKSPPTLNISSPDDQGVGGTGRQSFTIRKTRERDTPPSSYKGVSLSDNHPDRLAPPDKSEGPNRKFKGLGRSTSVNSADLSRRLSKKRAATEGTVIKPAVGTESERSSISDHKAKTAETVSDQEDAQTKSRTGTLRTKSLGHGRRNSFQARRTRPSRLKEEDVPEETDQELAEEYSKKPQAIESQEALKPVYLKGLFSVSTTSNKPLSFIRSDIIRVIKQLGVEYEEMKGGFSCRHVPSIDINKVVDNPQSDQQPKQSLQTHRRRISFAGLRNSERDRDDHAEQHHRTLGTPKSSHRRAPPDGSYTNSEDSDDENAVQRRRKSPRAAGETTTQVQSDLGQSMILKFEVLVVKVPFLSLHGLQFKKVDGGTWQYKRMAETILNELRL